MANYVRGWAEEIETYDTIDVSTSGMGQSTAALTDTGELTDSILVDAAAALVLELDESMVGVDTFAIVAPDADLCFPLGGIGNYPYISLQEKIMEWVGSDEGGDTITWQWEWQSWQEIHGYQFSYLDRPFNEWGFHELHRKKPETAEDGRDKIFKSRVYFLFNINGMQRLCLSTFLAFLIGPHGYPDEGAASWLQNCPTDGKHQRRIMLYPKGLLAVDRTGAYVDPVEVRWLNFPLSRIKYVNRRGGMYEYDVDLKSMESVDHDSYQEWVTWADPE